MADHLLPDEQAMLARCQAATPGPWKANGIVVEAPKHLVCSTIKTNQCCTTDIQFIAHARTDLELLLQRVGQLREENERLRDRLLPYVKHFRYCKKGKNILEECQCGLEAALTPPKKA